MLSLLSPVAQQRSKLLLDTSDRLAWTRGRATQKDKQGEVEIIP